MTGDQRPTDPTPANQTPDEWLAARLDDIDEMLAALKHEEQAWMSEVADAYRKGKLARPVELYPAHWDFAQIEAERRHRERMALIQVGAVRWPWGLKGDRADGSCGQCGAAVATKHRPECPNVPAPISPEREATRCPECRQLDGDHDPWCITAHGPAPEKISPARGPDGECLSCREPVNAEHRADCEYGSRAIRRPLCLSCGARWDARHHVQCPMVGG